jgi:hypothetical protein
MAKISEEKNGLVTETFMNQKKVLFKKDCKS